MPQVSAGVLRSKPSSTSASASIRRAAALFFSPLAALRSSEAVRSSRVIDTAAPIDAAPLKNQHRVRVSLIWESLMSHSFGPLVLHDQPARGAALGSCLGCSEYRLARPLPCQCDTVSYQTAGNGPARADRRVLETASGM